MDGLSSLRYVSGEGMTPGCTMEKSKAAEVEDALKNVLLENLGSWHSQECYFDTCHLPKHG